MIEVTTPSPAPETYPPRKRVAALVNTLASVRFAVTVVILIALACVAGTLLPQGMETAAFAQKHPSAAKWLPLLSGLGLTNIFSCWWFLTLLCVLAATVSTCTMRRIATVRRATGFAQRRAFGSMLAHVSILLILGGGVVRGVWGVKGYVELREGETKSEFQIENRVKPLPFALQLAKFEIQAGEVQELVGEAPKKDAHQLIVQWPARKLSAEIPVALNLAQTLKPQGEEVTPENSFEITVLKYIPDFAMDAQTHEVTSRSSEANNPAILVSLKGPSYQNHRWLFAKFPDFVVHSEGNGPSPLRLIYKVAAASERKAGPVKNFKSTLRVVENGAVVRVNTVAVNSPFAYKGYTLYQTGYNPDDLAWTSLQVVRDPGVPLVYAGFVFMISGLFVVFYLNPWLETRRARA